METARVRSLAREILALPEPERQELAREVLPALLSARRDRFFARIDAARRRSRRVKRQAIERDVTEAIERTRARARHRPA